jgi:cell division protein FtsN
MKAQVSPVIAAIIIAVVVAGIGFYLYKQSEGKTFSKAEASGRMGANIDPTKLQQAAPAETPK